MVRRRSEDAVVGRHQRLTKVEFDLAGPDLANYYKQAE
jgi:hypothetical protein